MEMNVEISEPHEDHEPKQGPYHDKVSDYGGQAATLSRRTVFAAGRSSVPDHRVSQVHGSICDVTL